MFKGHTHSKETRKKMSESHTGIKHPCAEETKKKISNTLKGRPKSEESKRKLSNTMKGRPRNPRFININGRKKPHSEETKRKMRESARKLDDNPACDKEYFKKYGVLKSYVPYCSKFDNNRKRAVREFFGNLCICTGEPSYTRALNVHHIDHDKEQGCNGKPFNLVPMDDHHHMKELFNQKEYQDYINKTLREGFKWGIWNEQEYIEKVMY